MDQNAEHEIRGTIQPIESAINSFLVTVLVQLVIPATSRSRNFLAGWTWLDPYRWRHPSESGWLSYIGFSLGLAVTIAVAVGLLHWIARRPLMRCPRCRYAVGIAFILISVASGSLIPLCLHSFSSNQ